MLILTAKLKEHAVKNFGVAADATDQKFREVIGLKMASNKLTRAKYLELTKDESGNPPAPPAPKPTRAPVQSSDQINAIVDQRVKAALDQFSAQTGISTTPPVNAESVLSKSVAVQARVKSAAESYSTSKKSACYPSTKFIGGRQVPHPLAGQQARIGAHALDMPSDLDKAVAAAFFKWTIAGQCNNPGQLPRRLRLTDHEKDLVNYALRHMEWTGLAGSDGNDEGTGGHEVKRGRMLKDFEIKAILDDNTSGGLEAAPIAFDDALITIPVLYGELFPKVNVVNIARGRRIEGVAMINPTFTSGAAEGTPITLFNTAGFISAFDTTIFAAAGGIEIGLDFEEDSPINFGQQIVEAYGLKALEWLDRVIAVGNGTTEPLGIFNTPGAVVVNSDNGAAGPLTVSDHEGLMFGLSKAYRDEPGAQNAYIGNDIMYRRARGIPVGPTDERRVFGMDEMSYRLFDAPYCVQNNIPNGQVAFANLKRYRMYRRLGLQVRFVNDGITLAKTNTTAIIVRMRYGGQMETGNAVAKFIDGPQ